MFPYRGIAILAALCAFGAVQASLFDGLKDFYRFKHGLHHGHFNSSNSSINSNWTLPSGNHSHPGHFNPIGRWNFTFPIHRLNFSSADHFNSSIYGIWNNTGRWNKTRPIPPNFSNSGNFSSSFPRRRRPLRIRPADVSTNQSSAQPRSIRGVFSSIGRGLSINRATSRPAYQSPVYRPTIYQPLPFYRPAYNYSTWSRPSNNSWYYG